MVREATDIMEEKQRDDRKEMEDNNTVINMKGDRDADISQSDNESDIELKTKDTSDISSGDDSSQDDTEDTIDNKDVSSPPGGFSQTKPQCYSLLPKKVRRKLCKATAWIWKDMKEVHLIWIKLIFFFQSASLVVLYPYLTIHMRSLGLNVEEVAIVNSVVPAADMLGPPLAGIIADRIGNFRIFMSGLTFLGGAASLLLLFVPHKEISHSHSSPQLFCCDTNSTDLATCNNLNVSFEGNVRSSHKIDKEKPHWTCTHELNHIVITNINNINATLSDTTASDTIESDTTASDTIESDTKTSCMKMTCIRTEPTVARNWQVNLWLYVALRGVLDILRASGVMMFEGAVVVTIKQLGGDYGLQKLFGTFGAIIFGPFSGLIIDYASNLSGSEDFSPVFYLFFLMRAICAILILKLNLDFKPATKKVLKNVLKLVIQPHILMFLAIFFLAGSVWGFLESWLFWFLEDLGSTKLTMGVSLAVGTVAGIPLTIASSAIIRKLGHTNVIVMGMALYAVRMLGYSFITTPLQSLFFEILKPFGHSLLMIAAFNYVKDHADITNMASLEGIMGALYFGVGKAVGGLAGGFCIESIGMRNTLRSFSAGSFTAASLYLLFNILTQKEKQENKQVKEEEKV